MDIKIVGIQLELCKQESARLKMQMGHVTPNLDAVILNQGWNSDRELARRTTLRREAIRPANQAHVASQILQKDPLLYRQRCGIGLQRVLQCSLLFPWYES